MATTTEQSIADLKQLVYDQALTIAALKDQINQDACFFVTQVTFFHQECAAFRDEIRALKQQQQTQLSRLQWAEFSK